MEPVVDLHWLKAHRDGVVLADVRWYLDGRSGHGAYLRGHLPAAVFVDLDQWLAGAPSPQAGRHPLPDPEVFAAGMSEVGIGDEDVVVAYDDGGGVTAARLVWMLRVIGHDAALLDGGLQVWDGELEPGEARPPRPGEARRSPRSFTPRPWPEAKLAAIEDVRAGGQIVIDARDGERYRGEHEPIDPRAGHIPGARNVPCRGNLDERGRLLGADELRRRFERAGVRPGVGAISYCGSGVTACHNLLAMEHAGLGEGRLYAASFSQYSSAPELPVATGPDP